VGEASLAPCDGRLSAARVKNLVLFWSFVHIEEGWN